MAEELFQCLVSSLRFRSNKRVSGRQESRLETRQENKENVTKEKTVSLPPSSLSGLYRQIRINENSIGHSYESIFGSILGPHITVITIKDSYIGNHFQIINFLRFCELVVRNCPHLRRILLNTRFSEENEQQLAELSQIELSLALRKITLQIQLSDSLHNGEIKFNNGWIVKIGRGLDFYKPPESRISLGSYDMNLRECRETTVDIFYSESTD